MTDAISIIIAVIIAGFGFTISFIVNMAFGRIRELEKQMADVQISHAVANSQQATLLKETEKFDEKLDRILEKK